MTDPIRAERASYVIRVDVPNGRVASIARRGIQYGKDAWGRRSVADSRGWDQRLQVVHTVAPPLAGW